MNLLLCTPTCFHAIVAYGVVGLMAVTALADQPSTTQARVHRPVVGGEITEVRPEKKQLTLKTRKDQAMTLIVDRLSSLSLQDKPVALSQLAKGMRVRATYQRSDGDYRVVTLREARLTGVDNHRRVHDLLLALSQYTIEQAGDYYRIMSHLADGLEEGIDELQEQVKTADAGASEQHKSLIGDLLRKQTEVRAKLAAVQVVTPAGWEDLRASVEVAILDCQRGIDQARSRIK